MKVLKVEDILTADVRLFASPKRKGNTRKPWRDGVM